MKVGKPVKKATKTAKVVRPPKTHRARKALKKYFIPHKQNDHRPQILRVQSVVFVLVIAVAIESFFVFGTAYLAPRSHLFGAIFASTLVDGTNASRVANGMPALQENA